MLSFIATLILLNILVAPVLLLVQALYLFATNGDLEDDFISEKYQAIKFRWFLEQFDMWDDVDPMALWLVGDLIIGLASVFFMCLMGYWFVVPVGIIGALFGSRWYFQNK